MKYKENHVDKDGNSLEITCDLCQENLPSPTHYRRHNIDKHKKYNMSRMKYKESYCCDECGKTFKKFFSLTLHKRTHVDKSKLDFQCHMCEYASYSKRNLRGHIQLKHSDKTKYKHVCEYCGEKFLYPHLLDAHHVIILVLELEQLKI